MSRRGSAITTSPTLERNRKRDELLAFLRSHRYAVESTVSPSGAPQAAVVGVAISDSFEIVFDTLRSSRKLQNLMANPAIAVTFGSLAPDAARTVQVEGRAEVLSGPAHARLVALYLSMFPDGEQRQHWPGLVYVGVGSVWLRDSDFGDTPPRIDEWDAEMLRG